MKHFSDEELAEWLDYGANVSEKVKDDLIRNMDDKASDFAQVPDIMREAARRLARSDSTEGQDETSE